MATKLTVKRLDLIKAIKAKAAANKKADAEARAAAGPEHAFVEAFDKLLDEKAKRDTDYMPGASGWTKANIKSYFQSYVLNPLGITRKSTVLVEPKLFEKELAILEMATDETLSIDDSSDYFSFLKS